MKNNSKIYKVTLDGNFTQLPNSLLQSTELTAEEIYLIANLCSRPDGWVFLKTKYWKQTVLSRNKFDKAWKGLVDKGYIQSVKVTENNLIVGYDYKISYLPIFSDVTDSSDSRKPVRPVPGEHINKEHINTENINKDNNNSNSTSIATTENSGNIISKEMFLSLSKNAQERIVKENPEYFDYIFNL